MEGEPLFEVLDGGLLTTIQDAGRHDWTHLGVPESGAADPSSLAIANLLAGNDPGAAALELTIVGPTLRALRPAAFGLAGSDLGGTVDGRRLVPGRSHRVAVGDIVTFGGAPAAGCRAYLAVTGGFAVPEILGSRSTCLGAAFGGLDGRPIRTGDRLHASPTGRAQGRAELVWPSAERGPAPARGTPDAILRVLPGLARGLDALTAAAWRVSPSSDRVGIRLDGPDLPADLGGDVTTHGVPWGAIQLPPDGRPIVLGPDHQTTGGYRVVAVVISADRPVIGQLAPGATVRFVTTTQDEAIAALVARRRAILDGAAALRDAAGWDALTEAAGG